MPVHVLGMKDIMVNKTDEILVLLMKSVCIAKKKNFFFPLNSENCKCFREDEIMQSDRE